MLDRVTERVYADTSGQYGGNFGFVVLDDQVVFIDAGMVHLHMAEVCNWIETEFSLPVSKLIYTHSHSDHVWGAQGLGSVSRISSIPTQENCAQNMKTQWKHTAIHESAKTWEKERPTLWDAVQTLEIQLPDITFKDTLTIGINNELSLYLFGGHTSGSSIVVVEPEHIVFVGDLIFNGVFPYIGDSSCNPDRWIMALQKVVAADYSIIIPGHGQLCKNDEIERQLVFFEGFKDRVNSAIENGIPIDEFQEKGLVPTLYETTPERLKMAIDLYFEFYS